MSAKISAVPDGRMLETRPGNSRKLLSRKAREKAPLTSGPSVEDSFPPPAAIKIACPLSAPNELQAGTAKGAGQPRATRRLRPGDISPNTGTIVAAMVRLVVERGELSMSELVDLMSGPSFVHPKARPSQKGWSQGYVAGAIRNGFLTQAVEALPAEARTAPAEERSAC